MGQGGMRRGGQARALSKPYTCGKGTGDGVQACLPLLFCGQCISECKSTHVISMCVPLPVPLPKTGPSRRWAPTCPATS